MAACQVCDEALVLQLEPEEDDEETLSFPDDLELQCKCHFHWQCLLDQSTQILLSLKCPVCDSPVVPVQVGGSSSSSASPQSILTTYTNEGGVQHGLDILPDLKEEAYIEEYPESRPARALHVMCAEGDVAGVVELLKSISREMDENQIANMLRYQDPFAEGTTALHLAVENSSEEIVWLLLWTASKLPDDAFPEVARRDAESVGLQRSTATIGGDIRAIKNEAGQTVGDLVRSIHSTAWAPFIINGVFDP